MVEVKFKKKPFEDAIRYKKLAKYLDNNVAVVGFWSNDTNAKGVTYKKLALVHEYGTTKIPARPFMSTAFKKCKNETAQILLENYSLYLSNKLGIKAVLKLPAQNLKKAIQQAFESPLMTPLSPKTMTARRGGSSAKPLIDTGNLRRSVAYVITPKSGMGAYTHA